MSNESVVSDVALWDFREALVEYGSAAGLPPLSQWVPPPSVDVARYMEIVGSLIAQRMRDEREAALQSLVSGEEVQP